MDSLRDLTKYKYIVIDGLNFSYRWYHGTPMVFNDLPTGILYGFADFFLTQRTKYKGVRFVVLWENGDSWRKDIYPEYKAHRKKNKQDKTHFFTMVAEVKRFLQAIGVYQVWQDRMEADDLAAYFAMKYKDVLLVSGDHDWQMLAYDADIMVKDTIFNSKTVKVDPRILFWTKVIRGDTSDHIKAGFPMLREDALEAILPEIQCVDDIERLLREKGNDVWADRAVNARPTIDRNFELVTLHAEKVDIKKLKHIRVKLDSKKAEELLTTYGMEKMVQEYQKIAYRVGRGTND